MPYSPLLANTPQSTVMGVGRSHGGYRVNHRDTEGIMGIQGGGGGMAIQRESWGIQNHTEGSIGI